MFDVVGYVMSGMTSDIKWNSEDQTLSGWMNVNGARVYICIPRDLIHSIPIYNDATEQEIESLKSDIIERLAPTFSGKAVE